MDDRPPVWKRTSAAKISRLVEEPAVLARFQEIVLAWCNQRHVQDSGSEADDTASKTGDGKDLLPLPDRQLTLEETYVILSAIHDSVRRDHHINPWRADWDERKGATYKRSVPYAVLLSNCSSIVEENLAELEHNLCHVTGDLTSRKLMGQCDSKGSAETSEAEPRSKKNKKNKKKWSAAIPPGSDSPYKFPVEVDGDVGNFRKKDIAAWYGVDTATLGLAGENGEFYACRFLGTGSKYQIWFTTSGRRADANQKRLSWLSGPATEGADGSKREQTGVKSRQVSAES